MDVLDPVYIALLGLLIGAVGVGLPVYLHFRDRKRPVFESVTDVKVQSRPGAPGSIAISYDGRVVERVTSTTVWFWNQGRGPIKSEDVRQPLVLTLTDEADVEILGVDILRKSRDEVVLGAEKTSQSSVGLDIDFLDHRDGVVMRLVHTGSENTRVSIDGVILGSPKGIKRVESEDRTFKGRNVVGAGLRTAVIGIFGVLLVLAWSGVFSRTPSAVTVNVAELRDAIGESVSAAETQVIVDRLIAASESDHVVHHPIFKAFMVLAGLFYLFDAWHRKVLWPESLRIPSEISTESLKE